MSSYRFCRTDDIGLLVDALNRCWAPHFPGEPPITAAAFKRSIRDLQVWCSSCMVAFSGSDPVGVLVGAKRPSGTLVHRIAVHPDHVRQGHGRHLLASLSSKLSILGPPRIVAEVPESLPAACALFDASGFKQEAVLSDYVLEDAAPPAQSERTNGTRGEGFVIPLSVDDAIANGLIGAGPGVCWERTVETLTARKDEIRGLAVASDERLEAYVMYRTSETGADQAAELVAIGGSVDDGGARVAGLLERLRAGGVSGFRLPKVHPAEVPTPWLEALGFRPAARHRVLAATAQPG
jgi:GNAT superfamily N-acetyltransferase